MPNSRKPKAEATEGVSLPKTRPSNVKSETTEAVASTLSQIPVTVPIKEDEANLDSKAKVDPEKQKTKNPDLAKYHEPYLTPEEDEVVMRKYYPAEMSDARVEMYKTGVLPKPMDEVEKALADTRLIRQDIATKDSVVHWFRGDLRVFDNTALHFASKKAQMKPGTTLIGLYIISPQDFEAHIKSPARVDFILRSLQVLKEDLAKLDIPLWVQVLDRRKEVNKCVLGLLEKWGSSHLFANLEYEVDELRRDARLIKAAAQKKVDFTAVHDAVVVPPGKILTKGTRTPFAVFTPFFKAWVECVHQNPEYLEVHPPPASNPPIARSKYSLLFKSEIPTSIAGKELHPDQADYVRKIFPAGEHAALARLDNFLEKKAEMYKDNRDFPDGNGTSLLSVHFAAGTLSSRTAVYKAREKNGTKLLNSGNKGIMCWISEVGWREFYRSVLINFPWVCMTKPYKTEYSNIPWKYNEEHFQAWREGRTGFPIVDAAMRQLRTMKYVHNRTRMIVASFLTKDLCLDWRKGEKFFMEHLIDGDLASNNGGWGWSSSSGCDPQPYFRIFNPLLQSEKFDPEGDYIRKWVPELSGVHGKAIHAPYDRLSKSEWKKIEALGYTKPLVKHHEAKDVALEMYKTGLGRDKP
ncbi:deoxyribodipyrimidine photo-lyase [Peziza echinospora]|nr:deoxyribodipyrimidine photo-lyase [Peziza echinospora]